MAPKDDLETLFAKRREIDRALLDEHSREVVILFTDIVGFTRLSNELSRENTALKDEMGRFKIYPVLRIGLSYKF